MPSLSPSPSAAVQKITDHDRIKSIVEVYRHIFNIWTLEYQTLPQVQSIVETKPEPLESMAETLAEEGLQLSDSPVYTLTLGPDLETGRMRSVGMSSLPKNTSPQIANAYVRLDNCDFALDIFMRPMQERLQTVGARVNWLLVTPFRLLTVQCEGDDEGFVPHSIFGITSQQGEQYTADFTVEQFGHEGEANWFMTQEEYLAEMTEDRSWQLCDNDDPFGFELDLHLVRWKGAMKHVARGLDWEALEKMGREDRLAHVAKTATEVFGEVHLKNMLGEGTRKG